MTFRLVGCGDVVVFVTFNAATNQLTNTYTLAMSEEVNNIDVNEKLTYAAVADDSGHLTIIDLKSRKVHKVSELVNLQIISKNI